MTGVVFDLRAITDGTLVQRRDGTLGIAMGHPYQNDVGEYDMCMVIDVDTPYGHKTWELVNTEIKGHPAIDAIVEYKDDLVCIKSAPYFDEIGNLVIGVLQYTEYKILFWTFKVPRYFAVQLWKLL